MGCLLCKFKLFRSDSLNEEIQPKAYSWDARKAVDLSLLAIQNLENETIIRKPGSLSGEQFIIENCKSCKILILDYTATVSIDDCTNCFIFLGPVKSSVFLRDSSDCKVATSCQQFRSRDCKRIELFLHCTTQPIIEASTNMKFACLQCFYPELPDQIKKSGLSKFSNNWSEVHDFTPVPGEKNFSLLPNGVTFSDQITDVADDDVKVTVDQLTSCFPLTFGNRAKLFEESCLVVFFCEKDQEERIWKFLRLVTEVSCILIQTKEIQLSNFEAERLFGKSQYTTSATIGPLVALEINGNEACTVCAERVKLANEQIDKGVPFPEVFVSSSYETSKLLNIFYGLAQMQMAV